MIKAVVFDLDGTILNTIIGIKDSVNAGLNKINAKLISEEETLQFIGDGLEQLLKRSIVHSRDESLNSKVKDEDYHTDLEEYVKYYNEYRISKTVEFPGMTDTLLSLKDRGYMLFVLSNKIDRDVKAQMEYFFKDIFTEAIGESPLVGKKPGTKGIEYIKGKYNLKNDEIIYVGDSHVDMEFSKNAKLKVIACMYGYERIYNIMDYHPDFIINNPKELLDIL